MIFFVFEINFWFVILILFFEIRLVRELIFEGKSFGKFDKESFLYLFSFLNDIWLDLIFLKIFLYFNFWFLSEWIFLIVFLYIYFWENVFYKRKFNYVVLGYFLLFLYLISLEWIFFFLGWLRLLNDLLKIGIKYLLDNRLNFILLYFLFFDLSEFKFKFGNLFKIWRF